jgi:hypothetical protein
LTFDEVRLNEEHRQSERQSERRLLESQQNFSVEPLSDTAVPVRPARGVSARHSLPEIDTHPKAPVARSDTGERGLAFGPAGEQPENENKEDIRG